MALMELLKGEAADTAAVGTKEEVEAFVGVCKALEELSDAARMRVLDAVKVLMELEDP
jgi:hypothetical protein